MTSAEDPVAIIGTACSLPGGVKCATDFWSVLLDGGWSACSTSTPASRAFESLSPSHNYVGKAGWIGREGVEDFDAAFFNITPGEAQSLRPNCRLALELTHKALENAGLPPASLRGKNVAVAIAVGTEDGWDLRRMAQEGEQAVDHNWATSSDPSAVAGRVAHFFDFHGACSTVSNACAGGAFSLREGIRSLFLDDADCAIIGAISTHLHPAALKWASAVAVTSHSGRCSAFSEDADGYMPSEGAVFFVLKRSSRAIADGNPIDGLIRSISVSHNGATRTLTTPNVDAQKNMAQRALSEASLTPSDISFLEAHGTGTKLGDMLEMEAIQSVYAGERDCPLLVSSAKTIVGHCQAAAALVGILKAVLCFKHRIIPPHHVEPREAYTSGNILVPTRSYDLNGEKLLYAAVSSFGFTGSIASIVLQEPPTPRLNCTSPHADHSTIVVFSAKTEEALLRHIRSVGQWAKSNPCNLVEIASILCLTRDYYEVRRAMVVPDVEELVTRCLSEDLDMNASSWIDHQAHQIHVSDSPPGELMSMLNLSQLCEEKWHGHLRDLLDALVASSNLLQAAALLYQHGHSLSFNSMFQRAMISPAVLRSFPTYPFQRVEWWYNAIKRVPHTPTSGTGVMGTKDHDISQPLIIDHVAASMQVATHVGFVLHISDPSQLNPSSNIFDVGIDSINSIELAKNLSSYFRKDLTATDLYALLTINNIAKAMITPDAVSAQVDPQAEIDELIKEFGEHLQRDTTQIRHAGDKMNILLTGATGTLGTALLVRLVTLPDVRIFCPVRGDPIQRLHSELVAKGHSIEVLGGAIASGRLHLLRTTDLSEPYIGISQQDYESLLKDVTVIIHGAWRLDFNLPVKGFRSTLLATRRLADFCAKASHKIVYHFITSFSASFGFPHESVPEVPLAAKVDYALPQGYAISKLVAEHSLYHIQNQDPEIFNLDIIRIGQICGHSQTGSWSREEMIPMMLASLPVLKAVPADMPEVSWIPSDVCADTLRDIVVKPDHPLFEIHNVANPHIVPWAHVVKNAVPLQAQIRYVSWAEYITIIRTTGGNKTPISRLLPYFEESVTRLPSRYCNLDVTMTVQKIPYLKTCPQITPSFVQKLYSSIRANFAMEDTQGALKHPASLPPAIPVAAASSVFLFGPWSTKFVAPGNDQHYTHIFSILRDYASEDAKKLGEGLMNDQALYVQLQTLAFQLATFHGIVSRGITPLAVVGYCFGEFAAAIAAGILSERTVVCILSHRASALRDVSGAMLNVFIDVTKARAHLAGLSDPPDIAILAGPQHVVLSGSKRQISEAKTSLETAGVKTLAVHTSLPYHSQQVDPALELFAQMQPFVGNPGNCIYISCLTGTTVAHERLGVTYWLRHLREPVRFLSGMETVRQHLRTNTVIDIGPEVGLQSVVARYRWEGFQLIPVQKFLSALGPTEQPSNFASNVLTEGTMPPLPKLLSRAFGTRTAQQHEAQAQATDNNTDSGTFHRSTTSSFPVLDPFPSATKAVERCALDILVSMFEYKASPELLCKTFHNLGIDSLAFVRFSEAFEKSSGRVLSPSYFTSELSLSQILARL